MDDVLDKLNTAISCVSLDSDGLGSDDLASARNLTFATNIEQAGDAVDRTCSASSTNWPSAAWLSGTGRDELTTMIMAIAHVRTAACFLTGDERAARLLAAEKEAFRTMQTASTDAHFDRLRSKRVDTTETSALHLDALRDLKMVNNHIVAAAAYPVLENKGELLSSRIRQTNSE